MDRPRISSFYRWMLPLIVTITLVACLIGIIALRYVETQLVAAAGESLTLAAVDIADKLDVLMTERYGDIQMMARSRTFHEHNATSATQYLEWMKMAYPIYEWLAAPSRSPSSFSRVA